MADIDIKNNRREKKRNKDKKTRRIAWIVIASVIVALIVMKICEVDFSTLKDRFTDSDGKFTLSANIDKNAYPYNIDSSENVVMTSVGNKLGILTDLSYTVINPSDASAVFTANHGYSNPVIKTSDSYSIIFDQGASKLRLDSHSENVYETSVNNSILCADVADNGFIAYATTSKEKKSDVYVCNKALNKKLSYKESYGYITAIAVNSSGSTIAFAAVNSENAQIKTNIYLMKCGDDKPEKQYSVESNVLDLKFSGSKVYIVGHDFISVIDGGENLVNVMEPGSMNNVSYDFTSGGELVLVYDQYVNSTDNRLIYVSKSGKIKNTIKISGTVKDVSASSDNASVLLNDGIVTYKLSDSEKISSIVCNDSVRSIERMSSNVFMRRQSLIEREDS